MAAAARSFNSSPAPTFHRLGAHVRRAGGDLGYHVLALPATVLAFTTVVAGVVIALCLAITIIGAPAALAVFAVFRANAELERRRAALTLGVPVSAFYRPRAGGLLARLRAALVRPAELARPRLAELRGHARVRRGRRGGRASGRACSASCSCPRGTGRCPSPPSSACSTSPGSARRSPPRAWASCSCRWSPRWCGSSPKGRCSSHARCSGAAARPPSPRAWTS